MNPERIDRIQSAQELFVDECVRPYTSNPIVITAFLRVDRGSFLPDHLIHLRKIARKDKILPLQPEKGSSMSQPSVVAKMLDALSLTGNERVFEVGTASGYGSALLSLCAAEVHTMEQDEELGNHARKRLSELGYENVTVHSGDGVAGLPAHAPFDRIIVTAGVSDIPQALFDQLTEGGVIVAPVEYDDGQTLVRGEKRGNTLYVEEIIPVSFYTVVSDEHGGYSREARKKKRTFDIVIREPLSKEEHPYTSLEDFAEKSGITPEEAREIFRVFGVADPTPLFFEKK